MDIFTNKHFIAWYTVKKIISEAHLAQYAPISRTCKKVYGHHRKDRKNYVINFGKHGSEHFSEHEIVHYDLWTEPRILLDSFLDGERWLSQKIKGQHINTFEFKNDIFKYM